MTCGSGLRRMLMVRVFAGELWQMVDLSIRVPFAFLLLITTD